jgi:hypothetical protein
MKNYLREQSTRQLLGNSLGIYRHHFGLLFLLYLVPTFPFNLWSNYLAETTGEAFNIGYYVSLPFELLPSLAIAVAISDICLGNKPSVKRSYARVWRCLRHAFLTWLVFFAGLALSFLLVVIPGFVFYAFFMFVFVITVVEQRTTPAAFSRSKALGQGYYLRNLGVVGLLLLFVFVLMMAAFLIWSAAMLALPALADPWPVSIAQALLVAVLVPPVYVGTVLLYYDMRVRKEAYDNTALTEDLMR